MCEIKSKDINKQVIYTTKCPTCKSKIIIKDRFSDCVICQSCGEVFEFENLFENLFEVLLEVSKKTGYHIDLITSKSRNRDYVNCRAAYSYICKKFFKSKFSLSKIGKEINVSHDTVIHYLQNVAHFDEVQNIVKKIL